MSGKEAIPEYFDIVIQELATEYGWDEQETTVYDFVESLDNVVVYKLREPLAVSMLMPSAVEIARNNNYTPEAVTFFLQLYTLLKVHAVSDNEVVFSSSYKDTSVSLTAYMVYDLVDSGFNN
ncbi:hypothetical protein PR1_85 [Providencia phage vB_PreS_PR1]|uniref:Uncharacterized protein n=1 Tax=Providencia phage vB_PreS_PR1 TaxID=1931407 RepID=A0A1S6KV51_9CAUD|nr:hypothetical protein FDH30_gp130 [Providencia phage vB_PreS_PR1]AQT25296.1 hypothetical protein PR1_85 [Providencia phage vB_PreS_PR1]